MPRKFERTKAIRGTVSTEFEGRTYDGDFTVRDGWLEVSSRYGSKGTWVRQVETRDVPCSEHRRIRR
jgi:hypothetical protein